MAAERESGVRDGSQGTPQALLSWHVEVRASPRRVMGDARCGKEIGGESEDRDGGLESVDRGQQGTSYRETTEEVGEGLGRVSGAGRRRGCDYKARGGRRGPGKPSVPRARTEDTGEGVAARHGRVHRGLNGAGGGPQPPRGARGQGRVGLDDRRAWAARVRIRSLISFHRRSLSAFPGRSQPAC